ncbi:asparagine synthase (glutamine-hydrolyzing) [uncultured Draconibacterium sp.]|uniref:asparagine synthase (glutamine-hydrolyzing) n=1 Tax=uncultured Draconibacterium sp. TaxID=1573823 RepID=UPI0029C76C3A|nr:asparagine synthase (glutamine-hydrolyzing) [uncultured Draconibacterium sp.]
MCGIAGYFDSNNQANQTIINRMLSRIHHRGPDECGIYLNKHFGFGNVRLSIIDIVNGQQPLPNEDLNLWIVFNGEIFNYIELRNELKSKGHFFRTQSDTEVIIHLYEEFGEDCLSKLNGQFAFSIWDNHKKELFLARDRIGIRPLFYYNSANLFVYGSEIKAIFEHPKVNRKISVNGLAETFTFWTTISPNTIFEDIKECPPGHFIKYKNGQIRIEKYWDLDFATEGNYYQGNFEEAKAEFDELFRDSIKIRLRADVPVAAYLSGGIDSSATTAYIKEIRPDILRTFSIGFTESEFDESHYQKLASEYFKTEHTGHKCTTHEVGKNFPKVIWHSEIPLLRTSPSPMYSLSNKVRENNIKVVITGEGADELLAGYNIFKENKIRHFWSKYPDSKIRPLLLKKLYPYIPSLQNANPNVLRMFFAYKLTETDSPIYSHLLRWKNSSNIIRHFHPDILDKLSSFNPNSIILKKLNGKINHLDSLAKAQYIETTVFLAGYLLSSQGDRMGMANSVEGRYPFLDHRIIEFCASLPPEFKLKGLNEKVLLKSVMKGRLPDEILKRPKQAYRAPIHNSFLGEHVPGYVKSELNKKALQSTGIFNYESVSKLLNKMTINREHSEVDNMALTAILSTQLLHKLFIKEFRHLNINELISCTIRSENEYLVKNHCKETSILK